MVGCKVKNASPKAGEKEGSGAVIPRSVPANLEVYPHKKWYCAWSSSRIETGGNTPKASADK
jgi:hypothetical protein